MKPDVKVVKYRQLPHIKSNDVNNSLLDFMNQEAEIGDCHSYENEVHNEGMFIQDNNMDAFTGQVMKWTSKFQPPVQVNERSKIVANNAWSSFHGQHSTFDVCMILNVGEDTKA